MYHLPLVITVTSIAKLYILVRYAVKGQLANFTIKQLLNFYDIV